MNCNKAPEYQIQKGNEKFWHVLLINRTLNKQKQVVEEKNLQVFRTRREVDECISLPAVVGFTEAQIAHDPTLVKPEAPEVKAEPEAVKEPGKRGRKPQNK